MKQRFVEAVICRDLKLCCDAVNSEVKREKVFNCNFCFFTSSQEKYFVATDLQKLKFLIRQQQIKENSLLKLESIFNPQMRELFSEYIFYKIKKVYKEQIILNF